MDHPKGSPLNSISKLLLNSLYGKFGMKPENTVVEVFNKNTEQNTIDFHIAVNKGLDKGQVSDLFYIDDDNIALVRKGIAGTSNYVPYGLDINVGIAAMITAGGRMYMSDFKNLQG